MEELTGSVPIRQVVLVVRREARYQSAARAETGGPAWTGRLRPGILGRTGEPSRWGRDAGPGSREHRGAVQAPVAAESVLLCCG